MNSFDLSPLYRNSIGFDGLGRLLDSALNPEAVTPGYPPYNIEVVDDNRYSITLAVAGFDLSELDITVDKDQLIVSGKKAKEEKRKYLHQGIANRAFERKFNLADHVEVTGAELKDGMLSIGLVKEVPEAMKPKTIAINNNSNVLEHDASSDVSDKREKAA
ncbi:Hsp20 family protein [Thalassotalea fusca]